jgi:hypothetical protein
MPTAEEVIRTYLNALRDPQSLRDEEAVEETRARLESTDDPIERLRIQSELDRLAEPDLDAVEDDFVVHAKAWADEAGISAKAFAAEGVPNGVLRRAGFPVSGGDGRSQGRKGGRGGGRRSGGGGGGGTRRSSGTRVTTQEVIDAMPKGAFTVKGLQEASGASPAVVRKAITAEVEAGRLEDVGTDPDHRGPGRAPRLFKRTA